MAVSAAVQPGCELRLKLGPATLDHGEVSLDLSDASPIDRELALEPVAIAGQVCRLPLAVAEPGLEIAVELPERVAMFAGLVKPLPGV
jgi:hypothetical protein